jgi:hypothetical protein
MGFDIQAFFGSRNLKVFTNGSELRFCCTGEIEAFWLAVVADQETTQTLLFVNVQEVENMRTPDFFGQTARPCTFINSVSCEIKYYRDSSSQHVLNKRTHDGATPPGPLQIIVKR